MNVIYRQNITDRLDEAIELARRKDKVISTIQLTAEESRELSHQLHGLGLLRDAKIDLYKGIRIEVLPDV